MPIIRNNHAQNKFKECKALVRIPDVEMFPQETTLTWKTPEPTDQAIKELFEKRFDLCFNETIMRVSTFRVLSKARWGIERYSASWIAEMQYVRDFEVPQQKMFFKEGGIYYFYGNFTFWRIKGEWCARIC